MLDETVFRGSRLCVVGNICRDVKTAPLCAGRAPLPRRRDADGFHCGNDRRRRGQQRVVCGRARRGSAVCRQGGRRCPGHKARASLARPGRRVVCPPRPRTCRRAVPWSSAYTNGCRHFISHQPNNYTLSFSDIDLALLAGGGHLLRADVWFSRADAGRRQCPAPASGTRPGLGNVVGPELGSLLGLCVGGTDPVRGKRPCGRFCRWSTWCMATSAS